MYKQLSVLLSCLSIVSALHAQTPDSTSNTTSITYGSTEEADYVVKPDNYIAAPRIGFGVGMMSFYGDLYDKHFQPPMIGRVASEIYLSQDIDFLQLNFYAMFGKLGANERITSKGRNLNFESQIRVGGANVTYNFSHFLPKDKNSYPFISLGIENVEFLSKTDLKDRYGNTYNYWSDGTIRNLPESDPNAVNAFVIHRDYKYESDIRELNIDGFGKYTERTLAIPVGVGVSFKLNSYISCKLGTTMHFTFTDYIDGITEKSIGNRIGNKKNDHFMMSSFSLSYNFGYGPDKTSDTYVDYSGVDFLALENEDTDEDGVIDMKDKCAGTPPKVIVDTVGCPQDDDGDGVPNEMDDEKNTPTGSLVNIKGVQITDSLLAEQYRFYNDSTGEFAEVIYLNKDKDAAVKGVYTVQLGIFNKGIPSDLMQKLLSIKDLSTLQLDDSITLYSAGTYGILSEAENRKNYFASNGFPDSKVVFKQNNTIKEPPKLAVDTSSSPVKDIAAISVAEALSTGTVLRVQLGAYKKKLSKNVFKGVSDLIEIETADGLYKYMSGSFKTFEEAAKHKTNLVLMGYKGAFITAYKGGGRITLVEGGATTSGKNAKIVETPDNVPVNAIDKKLLIYKVQIGIFKNDPPDDKLELFTKIPDVRGEKTPQGITMYTVGVLSSYKQAEALKEQLIKKYNLTDAFVIAYYRGTYISVAEALELEK